MNNNPAKLDYPIFTGSSGKDVLFLTLTVGCYIEYCDGYIKLSAPTSFQRYTDTDVWTQKKIKLGVINETELS